MPHPTITNPGAGASPETHPELYRKREYTPAGPAEHFIVPLLKERIGRCLTEYTRSRGAARVLDAGCGNQPFRRLLQEAGHHYSSLDVAQNVDGTVDFLGPLDGELPAALGAAAPFDLVLCTEVLEHVADWAAAFANLRRLAGGRGVVVLTCPQFYMLHEEPFDFWRPTEYAVRYYAERFGFRVVCFDRLGGPREVLGTLLGFCTFKPRRPGVFPYVFARGLNVFKRLTLRFLHSRLSWAGPAELRGGTYLANFAVLEGRAPGSDPPGAVTAP
jgi:SAM-dependent methyltransferase